VRRIKTRDSTANQSEHSSACLHARARARMPARTHAHTHTQRQRDRCTGQKHNATAAHPLGCCRHRKVLRSYAPTIWRHSSRRHRWSPSNNGSRHCSSAARLICHSLTPVLNMRDTVVGFIFLLLSALEVFWLHGTIIIFFYNNNLIILIITWKYFSMEWKASFDRSQ